MKPLLLGAVPCLLMAQATPLTFHDIEARARRSTAELDTDALLAGPARQMAATKGFLREGPTLALSAGPRRNPALPTTTDASADVDLPLFLARGTRRRLVDAFGTADPLLRTAARLEGRLQLHAAYLDAWFAAKRVAIRAQDLDTVTAWLKAARVRVENGADPAFQASLVEGDILKARLDLGEAQQVQAQAWATLRTLAEVPDQPVPLADPGDAPLPAREGLQDRYQRSALRQALQARSDLETASLRQEAALATSRWSLRGSYGREVEDRIAKVGVAYRFGRPGESTAIRQEAEAKAASAQRDLQAAMLSLDGRFQADVERLDAYQTPVAPTDFQAALRAVGLRLTEGKDAPSVALPIRRQLLEAQIADLQRTVDQHRLAAELDALTTSDQDTHHD